MTMHEDRIGTTRAWVRTVALAHVVALLVTTPTAAEQRKYVVMLAHAPKSFQVGTDGNGNPIYGLPPAGLHNAEEIRKLYFDQTDPNLDSFTEYWREISYGDVVITGSVPGWVTLPWPFQPDSPNGGARPSPADYIDLRRDNMLSELSGLPIPPVFSYGAGEDFCDLFSTGDNEADQVSADKCGALIIIDPRGWETATDGPPPIRRAGMVDIDAVGMNVWTPGERFMDLDTDNRWDGMDEKNDRMCHGPNGCLGACSRFACSGSGDPCPGGHDDCPDGEICVPVGSDQPCETIGDCPPEETCGDTLIHLPGGERIGRGPRGCRVPGCGDLRMPFFDWDSSGDAPDPGDECVIPKPCQEDSDCKIENRPAQAPDGRCFLGVCIEQTCVPDTEDGLDLPECCDEPDPSIRIDCTDGGGLDVFTEAVPGLHCGTPILCCEYDDANDSGSLDVVEPFEDYMIRWNPEGRTAGSVWVPVDDDYVRNNYPGDVKGLLARTGNGYYDPPDLFVDRDTTKMMQDAGIQQFHLATPKPGTRYAAPHPAREEAWFDQFWRDRYSSDPPPWPGGQGPSPPFNSPLMRPFDPTLPVPPEAQPDPTRQVRRWFKPNRGGWSGGGQGVSVTDQFLGLDIGTDAPDLPGPILPEETFGYYDGWVEHDDLPSSKYHHAGDKRLGEITAPTTDTVVVGGETYPAISGVDLGPHVPGALPFRDRSCVAAGPYAVNIHGEKGFDAGDSCIVELLTWRRDGKSETIGYQWEFDNGRYHPFAGPRRCSGSFAACKSDANCPGLQTCSRGSLGLGFRDYNLDGMVDQGEVRPARSANYSVDSNPFTVNDGAGSEYPFDRRRLVEDVVEALDASLQWDDFIDVNAMRAALCPSGSSSLRVPTFDPAHAGDPRYTKFIPSQGFVSGIVLTPPGSYSDPNRFPGAASYFPIHNEDNDDRAFMAPDWPANPFNPSAVHRSFNLFFHDLVICQDCRDFPGAVGYSAHEYLHTWEHAPDLYDYVRLDANPVEDENCPIGAWDIMAGSRGAGGLVHPIPPLKEPTCTGWIEPIDLTTVLTPGVERAITLPPAEFNRDGYYFLENEDRPGERLYFWSAGSGFDAPRLPGTGMLIVHANDVFANPDAIALKQRNPPFAFRIIQADGRGDLEACFADGNNGDAGDPWPGTSGATTFNFQTTPAAVWNQLNRWTGLDVTNVEPDGSGSVLLTLSWTPTNLPGLRFTNPPGGDSVESIYQVRFVATDVFGGTTIEIYFTQDENDLTVFGNGANRIAQIRKTSVGTVEMSVDWNVTSVLPGRYFLFAKLIPGLGIDNRTERKNTDPRPGRGNIGDGTLTIANVDVSASPISRARSETWTIECINAAGSEWRVHSSLTQPEPSDPTADPFVHAFTCPRNHPIFPSCDPFEYTSIGGEVRFVIREGEIPFTQGDRFAFTTTGITAVSRAVVIQDGRVSSDPIAVIEADPLSGQAPLSVAFDARDSVEPNGQSLVFTWRFGDDSSGTGATVQHVYNRTGTFTVTLRATNPLTGRFGETAVDIFVVNNRPTASFTASPTNGAAPLAVQFNAADSRDQETPAAQMIYQWDFGDGTTANDAGAPGVSIQTEHLYSTRANGTACSAASPCAFNATLTVTDADGKQDTATTGILVGNSQPVASVIAGPLQGPAPLTVRFNALNSFDADADPLIVDWDWGDGSSSLNVPVTGGGAGADGTVEHVYADVGEYAPTAIVRDRATLSTPGVATATWPGVTIVVLEGGTGGTSLRAIFRTTPTFIVANEPFTADGSSSIGDISSYQWSWGDGTSGDSGLTTTHTYTNTGAFQITLTVTDAAGQTNSTSRTIVVVAAGEGDGEPGEGNGRPIASLVIDPPTAEALVNQAFTFDARGSSDPDGDALRFLWTFGDGSPPVEGGVEAALLSHAYSTTGQFLVRLTVRDASNAQTSISQAVRVLAIGENRRPVPIIATGPRTASAPATLTFDGNASYDPDGDPIQFTWRFDLGAETVTQTGALVSQRFDSPGTFNVVLIVRDSEDAESESNPETILITPRVELPPPPPAPDPIDGGAGQEIPDSARQRPEGICGFGMIPAWFGSMFGLSTMWLARRRRCR